MKRIYVAGKYNDTDVIRVLANMRLGIRTCIEVFKRGFAPFCPWLDYLFSLMLYPGEALTVEDYYEYSMAWLDASDAILMLPNWKDSKGAIAELRRAEQLCIPIFYDIDKMTNSMRHKYGEQ